MSVLGIAASGVLAAIHPSTAQSRFKQIQQDFQELGQDLQSGNLSQAQTDFSALQQLLPGQQSGSTSSVQPATSSTNPVSQAVSQLGQDLKSGNLSAAQSDFAALQEDLQQLAGVSTHRFHHHHQHGGPILESQQSGQRDGPATLFGDLGQELQTGNLSAAQQTYSTLQQDFLQFIGSGNPSGAAVTTGSAPVSASLNISA